MREAADGSREVAGQDWILTTAGDRPGYLGQQQRGRHDRDRLGLKAGEQAMTVLMSRCIWIESI